MRPLLVVPLVLGGLAAFAASRSAVGDTDLFWHLAVGRDVVQNGLPRLDEYSWTIAGRPVLADQWLGDLLIYLAYATGSWQGIVALRALAVGALVAIVVWTALAERPHRPLIAVLAALPAIALSRFAWTDRPELFGLAMFAALIALLRAARRGSRVALAICAPLILVWANLHGSYALGLGLTLLVLVERVIADPAGRRRYAAVAVACVLATFVTPAGIGTWTSSGGHFLAPPRFVEEEGTPDVATLPGVLFSIALLASLASALLAPKPRGREVLFEIALLVPVAFVSMTATRHLVFFPIAAAPFLSKWAPDAAIEAWREIATRWSDVLEKVPWGRGRVGGRVAEREFAVQHASGTQRAQAKGTREHTRPPARRRRIAEIAAGVIAVVIYASAVTTAPKEPDLSAYPTGALPSLPPGPGLLNRYDWGGFLIWYAPATPVFVDGRLFPYVGDALDDYRAVIGIHADWRDTLRRRGIRTVLVRPSDAIAVVGADRGWPILARTPEWVLMRVPLSDTSTHERGDTTTPRVQ